MNGSVDLGRGHDPVAAPQAAVMHRLREAEERRHGKSTGVSSDGWVGYDEQGGSVADS